LAAGLVGEYEGLVGLNPPAPPPPKFAPGLVGEYDGDAGEKFAMPGDWGE